MYVDRANCCSEEEFHAELNESWISSGRGGRHYSKIGVVDRAANGIGWRELGTVEQIEKLHPEFQSQPFVVRKSCSLKERKIKVIDALGAQSRIHPRLCAKFKIRRGRKARGVEPFRQTRCRAALKRG